ncbi:unnamed protein product [Gongylonema pulchrum]|uniref:Uncharacterized protein n=1 Tax=Gongylonema pulchrum TaxID=637853 RepID=A0A183EYG2_9BILA|nr:unnamed protein product [Gongylonema pulchrum]
MRDFWKIVKPVGRYMGLEFKYGDDQRRVINAPEREAIFYGLDLWQYPCKITGNPIILAQFNFAEPPWEETIEEITPEMLVFFFALVLLGC